MWTLTRASLVAIALVVGAGVGAGCSSDPQVERQRYFEEGNAFFEQEKFKEAIISYLNALKADPRFGEARLKLAEAYARENDVRNAFRESVRAADLLPDNLDAQLRAGTFLLLAQQFEDAKARADKAIAIDPKSVDAQILRANAMAGLKDLDGAYARSTRPSSSTRSRPPPTRTSARLSSRAATATRPRRPSGRRSRPTRRRSTRISRSPTTTGRRAARPTPRPRSRRPSSSIPRTLRPTARSAPSTWRRIARRRRSRI